MTEPITVTVRLKIKPDKMGDLLGVLPELAGVTRTQPGVLSAELVYDPERPTDLLFIDHFESASDADAYFRWRADRGDLEWLGSFLAEPPVTEKWPLNVGVERV